MVGVEPREITESLVGIGINLQGILVSLLRAVDLDDILVNLREKNVGGKIFGKLAARGFILLEHAVGTVGGGVDVSQSEIAVHVIGIENQDLLIAALGTGPVVLRNTEFG